MTVTTSPPEPALRPLPEGFPTPQPNSPLGLVAGWGQLPVSVVEQALEWGYSVVAFCLSDDNTKALAKAGAVVERMTPGLLADNFAMARRYGITHGVFAGKVNKWVLLRNPKLDAKALATLKMLRERSDDGLMLALIEILAEEGFSILPQTAFLQSHFLSPGCFTQRALTEAEWSDVAYGFALAKGMGGLDVGQTVVIHQGMALAVEAIEGTDECLKRAGELAHKGWLKKLIHPQAGGVVVKVAKPNQDPRFDVPTVGLKTLQTLKKAGLKVLAAEAHQTFFLEPEAMVAYANRHGLSIVVTASGERF
ncbi:MAG: UDP-2,3-diacylglucosamine diphosphatase LpxI [Vampirovibrionales bacterium]